jgi:hypothetical protein
MGEFLLQRRKIYLRNARARSETVCQENFSTWLKNRLERGWRLPAAQPHAGPAIPWPAKPLSLFLRLFAADGGKGHGVKLGAGWFSAAIFNPALNLLNNLVGRRRRVSFEGVGNAREIDDQLVGEMRPFQADGPRLSEPEENPCQKEQSASEDHKLRTGKLQISDPVWELLEQMHSFLLAGLTKVGHINGRAIGR